MSFEGMTKVKKALIGNIHLLKKVSGYSAYDLAVADGFKGTLKEWLASLKGDPGYTPQKGTDYNDGEKGDPGTLENHSGIDALNLPIINVADPTKDTDAVNKRYADKSFVSAIKTKTVVLYAYDGVAETDLSAANTVILGTRYTPVNPLIAEATALGLPFESMSGKWSLAVFNGVTLEPLANFGDYVTILYIELE